MNSVAYSLLFMLRSSFRTHARMQIEILALRHQLAVLQRQKKRVSLRAADRLLWVLLSRIWKQWRSALVVVKPETVIAWHRKGFRLTQSSQNPDFIVAFYATTKKKNLSSKQSHCSRHWWIRLR